MHLRSPSLAAAVVLGVLTFAPTARAQVNAPYYRPDLEVFFGTTYILEHERISSVPESPQEDNLWNRSSDYVGLNARMTPIVEASTVTYFQPRFDAPSDFRILHESSLTVTITKVLAAKVGGSLWYDSTPPFGVKTYDLEVKNSLEVKLF